MIFRREKQEMKVGWDWKNMEFDQKKKERKKLKELDNERLRFSTKLG